MGNVSPVTVIGFLHTSPVHTPTFERLVAEANSDIESTAVVDEALLADARRLGPDAAVVSDGISQALDQLEDAGAAVIVCTCSTISGEAERLGALRRTPVIRIDRAMARDAVTLGPRVAVVAAIESTLAPTRQLIESIAEEQGRAIEITTVFSHGAWPRFECGDVDGYLDAVAATCSDIDGDHDVIVLAQASMAAVAERATGKTPILCSPQLAVAEALANLGS